MATKTGDLLCDGLGHRSFINFELSKQMTHVESVNQRYFIAQNEGSYGELSGFPYYFGEYTVLVPSDYGHIAVACKYALAEILRVTCVY